MIEHPVRIAAQSREAILMHVDVISSGFRVAALPSDSNISRCMMDIHHNRLLNPLSRGVFRICLCMQHKMLSVVHCFHAALHETIAVDDDLIIPKGTVRADDGSVPHALTARRSPVEAWKLVFESREPGSLRVFGCSMTSSCFCFAPLLMPLADTEAK